MSNPKRYHIGQDGKVAECRAFIRGCPLQDYKTIEGAETALFLQKEAKEHEHKVVELNRLFKDPKTLRSTASILMSGNKRGQTIRDYAYNLDSNYMHHGADPEIYFAKVTFSPTNLVAEPNVNVYAQRFTLPDYTTGETVNRWTLVTEYKNSSRQKIELPLDFNENPEQKMREAYVFFEEAARLNIMNQDTDLEKQTDELYNQFRTSYATIEEEIQGPNKVWEQHGWNEGLGNFKDSTQSEINADVDYGSSTLRPRSIERFLQDNPNYISATPDINLRVWDNDNETSGEWWSARYNNGEWNIDLVHRGSNEIETIAVSSPEEARTLMYDFVKNNMRVNDDWTAKEKSDYVADFMIQMPGIERRAEARSKQHAEKIAQYSRDAQERTNNDPLFQKTDKKSTMGKLLGMFN